MLDQVTAARERAAQRERERYRWHGDDGAQQVAQEMWRDFLADPKLRTLSGRDLAARYDRRVSYRLAGEIRDWIFGLPAFPAELAPAEWIAKKKRQAILKEKRAKEAANTA
jgi:hypothetical protein